MLHHLLSVTATNFFWLLFAFVGLAVWLLMQQSTRASFKTTATFIQTAPWPVQMLLFFSIGCFLFTPFTLLAFLLSLPGWSAAVYYVLLVAGASVTMVIYRKLALQYIKSVIIECKKTPAFCLGLFLVVGVGLLLLAGAIGSYTADGTDSYVHTARIALIAHDEFTLADSYFKDVSESRYHVNSLYAMYVAAVKTLGISAFDVWRFSFATFLIAVYLALFSIAWYVVPKQWKRGWPYILAAFSMLLALMFWRTANYPNETVLVWQSIFIIGLIQFARTKEWMLLATSATLIAFSQPTYSLMTACYLMLFIAVLALLARDRVREFSKRHWGMLLATLVVLAAPVVYSMTFPNRMADAYFNFQEAGAAAQLRDVGPFEIMNPPLVISQNTTFVVVSLLSAIGYMWLIRKSEDRTLKIAIGSLVIFYGLLAYNPIFIALFSGEVPPWLLQRFAYLNRIGSIAAALGLMVLLMWLLQKIVVKRWLVVAVTVVGFAAFFPAMRAQYAMVAATSAPSNHQLIVTDDLEHLRPQLEGQQVFATIGNSFILPSIIPTSQVVWMPTMNAVPMADMTKRKACADRLVKSLDIDDLRRAGVTRVLIGNWTGDLYPLATSKPYLKQIGANATFTVMEVQYPSDMPEPKEGVCDIPRGS